MDQSYPSKDEWKDIPGFEGIYQASNTGFIRTAPNKTTSNSRFSRRVWKVRVLKPKWKTNGKRRDAAVTLWKDGQCRDYLISRLVAMAWCAGYAEGLTVNHIDGNHANNSSSNLEWISLEENIRHGFEMGLYGTQKPIAIARGTQILAFRSLSQADRYLDRCNGYISGRMKKNHTTLFDSSGNIYRIVNGGVG